MTTNPVQPLQRQSASLGSEMRHSLRRLRLETAACCTCPHLDDYLSRHELNLQIETAISEIAAEWGFCKSEACLALTESDETQNNR